MTEEEAHIFIDELFNYINTKDSKIFSNYVANYDDWVSAPIKLQFFGGEVLLYPNLILNIIKYFKDSCYKNNLGDK
jgi:sulfatase maturation enzyme AslB (radical SAM superfamily)